MKISTIVEPNAKGQIVIPKSIRKALGITSDTPLHITTRGGGVYIYPVDEIISRAQYETSYAQLLKRTKGAWRQDDWKKTEKKRKKIEIAASKKRKRAW